LKNESLFPTCMGDNKADVSTGLDELREQIDGLDQTIFYALAERMKLADPIGEIKKDTRTPIHDPAREEQVIQRGIEYMRSQGVDDPDFVRKVYGAIFEASRRRQE